MSNLKVVTWSGDGSKFVMEAENTLKAIKKAVEANLWMGECEGTDINIHDLSSYTVEDATIQTIKEISKGEKYCVYDVICICGK